MKNNTNPKIHQKIEQAEIYNKKIKNEIKEDRSKKLQKLN